MGEANETQEYTISLKTRDELSYQDGFAEGYSRAWQDCWEYWIDRINESKHETQPQPTEEK